MPKVIQPRRHDKGLSAEEFWAVRQQQKQQPSQPQVYRSVEVASRHRFTKPSEQAKTFRPLSYFLRQQNTPNDQQLFQQEEDSYLGRYLKSVQGRVSPALIELKRWCPGFKGILHNKQKIYDLLWSQLEFEDSWILLQALIKDCRGEDISSWLQKGLTSVAEAVEKQAGSSFNLSLFNRVFDSLCIFMESSFEQISSKLQQFFMAFAPIFLKNSNKYLRKFSLEAFSYLLGNLSDEKYSDFLSLLLQLHREGFFTAEVPLPALLLQRLALVRGCLSTASLGLMLSQLDHFRQALQPETGMSLAGEYIYLVLSQLNPKGAVTSESILFDLNSVLQALLKYNSNYSNFLTQVLLTSFSKFIALAESEARRFDPRTPRETQSLQATWELFCDFYQQQADNFQSGQDLNLALAIVAGKNPEGQLFNRKVLEYYRENPRAVETLVEYLHHHVESPATHLLQILVLLCRSALSEFYTNGDHQELVYRLLLCLKRNPLPLLEPNSLSIDPGTIISILKSQKEPSKLILTLRGLTLLKLDCSQPFIDCVIELRTQNLGTYEQYLSSLLSKSCRLLEGELTPEQFYNWTQLPREIVVYSHHEIGWLKQAFDLHQAFSLLCHHITNLSGNSFPVSPLWSQLLVSRPSAVPLLPENQSTQLTMTLIASRNREVRLKTVHLLSSLEAWESQEKEVLHLLGAIDQQDVNLENERQVKRSLARLQELSSIFSGDLSPRRELLFSHLFQWSLGFAFTGFKLIETAFIALFSQLLCRAPHLVAPKLMPFLHYYNYRHSRQYDVDVSPANPIPHLANHFPCIPHPLAALVAEDLEQTDLETVEWIGLERVAEAVKFATEAKTNLHEHLSALVQAYFGRQFTRQKRATRDMSIDSGSPLLLPPKTRFLGVILKLSPHNFMPPASCLHYLRQQYFQVAAVRQSKRHHWQVLWEKGNQNAKTDKNERVKNNVNLSQLSPTEEDIYLHYLWKEMLEGSHHHKRNVLQHLRNELPHLAPKILPLLLDSLFLEGTETIAEAVEQLRRTNRKVLLSHMFILKAMLQHLRNQIGEEQALEKVFWLVLALIQVAHPSREPEEAPQQLQVIDNKERVEVGQSVGQEEGFEEGQGDELPEQAGKHNLTLSQLYKQHRKELQKLLQTLFTAHRLSHVTVASLLAGLLSTTRIDLPKAARSSVPGLLHVLLKLSQQKEYCFVLAQTDGGRLLNMLAETVRVNENGEKPLSGCYTLWLHIMANMLLPAEGESEEMSPDTVRNWQHEIEQLVVPHAALLLDCILTYLASAGPRGKNDKQQKKVLAVVEVLMRLTTSASNSQWSNYLLKELSVIAKSKQKLNEGQLQYLALLLRVLSLFAQKSSAQLDPSFLKKVTGLLPHLRDLQQRQGLMVLLAEASIPLGLSPKSVSLAQRLSEVSRNGLLVTLNFNSFFTANAEYCSSADALSPSEHEFFLHVLLSLALHEELSVRRAVNQTLRTFLTTAAERLNSSEGRQWGQAVERVTRVLLQLIHKPQEESLFWSLIDHLEACFSWFSAHSLLVSQLLSSTAQSFYLVFPPGNDYLKGLVSLSEANKLKALKQLRQVLQTVRANEEHSTAFRVWSQGGSELPHPLAFLILPILSYLVVRPIQIKSNLASSLSLVSLQILPLLSNLLPQSLLKRELKRLLSRLRFKETDSKINIVVIKMVGQLLEGLPGETAAHQLSSFVASHGFEQFHQKLTHNRVVQPEEQPEEEGPGRKERIPDFFDKLEELEEDEAVHRNFLSFEKKMMDLEDEENKGEGDFEAFLRKQVLPPLRTLLSAGQRAKEEEEASKSRVLLSVTTVQVLLRLPLDTFLREFQKVVNRLARFLKKRETETREYARGCLCAIAKAAGPQLLYSIVSSLQFNLKDNFDRHVLNYTLFKVIEGMSLVSGQLDYCLPLLLPTAVDELWGRTGDEKDMVARREAPTLKMEARKRKGLDLLQLVFGVLGRGQLNYCIDFLEKYLCQHLTSEDSLGKYDQMLGALAKGLSNNAQITDPANATLLLEAVATPIAALRSHLRWINSTALGQDLQQTQKWKVRKANKDHTLSLQEEAGRNRSIFARLNLEVTHRKNKETVTAALMQFHLTVLSILIRKQVISPTTAPTEGLRLLTVTGFLVDCLDHRDNRLVSKSLKILHLSLTWKCHLLPLDQANKLQSLRRQASRKVLALAERLTLADEELLKESFVFLNDFTSEAAVTLDTLPGLVSLVKIHLSTSDDQPQLSEVYKFLRTLLVKAPLYIYHPLVEDLHELLRVQLVTTSNRDIRELARTCLSLYLRDKSTLQPSIDFYNQLSSKQGRSEIDYNRRIKDELSFFLSNLGGRGQEVVFQLLREWVGYRSRQELEEYCELIALSVMTARTNQLAQSTSINNHQLQSSHPADSMLQELLQRVDKQKLKALGEKSLLWIGSPRHTPIRLCGASLLRLTLPHLPVLQQQSISIIANLLREELESFQERQLLQKKKDIIDPQWARIMNKMQEESGGQGFDLSVVEALRIMLGISEQGKELLSHDIIFTIWCLLSHSHNQIQQLSLSICLHLHLLAPLAQHQQQTKYSPKKMISKLLFSPIDIAAVEKLFQLLITQELVLGEENIRKEISQLLLGLALKAHIKPKAFERSLPRVLALFNHVLLAEELAGSKLRQIIVNDPLLRPKLLEMSLKLTSNSLISNQAQALSTQTAELMKVEMGANDYFKEVSQFQEGRRVRRQEEVTRKAEMVLLDPEGLGLERREKKRKLQ